MKLDTNLAKEVDKIGEVLRNDKSYYISWKANIAMSFVDEYYYYKKETSKEYMNYSDIHEIANKAAANFLKIFMAKREV